MLVLVAAKGFRIQTSGIRTINNLKPASRSL